MEITPEVEQLVAKYEAAIKLRECAELSLRTAEAIEEKAHTALATHLCPFKVGEQIFTKAEKTHKYTVLEIRSADREAYSLIISPFFSREGANAIARLRQIVWASPILEEANGKPITPTIDGLRRTLARMREDGK